MATIYQKTDTLLGTKNALILGVREAMFRPFAFGAWNVIYTGIYYSFCSLNTNNTNPVAETVTTSSYLDIFGFGINSDASTICGQAGNYSILMGGGPFNTNQFQLQNNAGQWQLNNGGQNGTASFGSINGVITQPGSQGNSGDYQLASNPNAAASYASYIGLRFTVANAGLPTQTIAVAYANQATITVALTLANLRSQLLSSSWSANRGIQPWNSGGSALALPGYFYLRSAFFNNQIRVHAYAAIKIS